MANQLPDPQDFPPMDEDQHWRETVPHGQHVRILLAILNAAISTGILASFTMIMTAIYRQRLMRKPSNSFILSLSITEFAVTAIIAPHFLAVAITGYWPSTYRHCQVLAFLNTFFPGMGIMNLILISIDRTVAILRPTKYRTWLCPRNARILASVFWLYAFLIACLAFADTFSRPTFDGSVMTCLLTGKNFLTLQLVCEVVPGLSATALCYTVIVVKLVKRSANIYTSGSKANKVNYEIRMTKIGCIVAGFFILTYLPYYTIMFQFRTTTPALLKLAAAILVVSSYNFDAFMYGYCNRNYRREIKKVLHSRCPWVVPVKPAESTETNNIDTMVTNNPATTNMNGGGRPSRDQRVRPETAKEERVVPLQESISER